MIRLLIATSLAGLSLSVTAAEAVVDYERDVRPILRDSCVHCHGPDESESGFRVDSRSVLLRGGDGGIATVVPGDADASYLIDLVSHAEPGMEMPPDDDRLSDEAINTLRRWIDQGAVMPEPEDAPEGDDRNAATDHWAFRPVAETFDHRTIDDFLAAELSTRGLTFSEPAAARDWLRRVSIVLTGLPPTADEIDAFERSSAGDADAAYADVVDRLLASPRFGERWAQHWLDVIRWAETNGSESNLYRKNAWMYRDWVVAAFNDDLPYDEFVRRQIAGDSMNDGVATGFLVAGPHVPAATVGREPSAVRAARTDRMDEVLQTVGASVMGVTVGCARCHNHKFDPLTIRDYYALSAVFQDVEFGSRTPELADDDPAVIKSRNATAAILAARASVDADAAWVEDWRGYREVHFPAARGRRFRVRFAQPRLQIDEWEWIRNDGSLAGRTIAVAGVRQNPATARDANPVQNLIDGNHGWPHWSSQASTDDADARPWIEFEFDEKVTTDRVRVSRDRMDHRETDYLNSSAWSVPRYEMAIEVIGDDGTWHPVVDTTSAPDTADVPVDDGPLGRIRGGIADLLDDGPPVAFVGRFVDPVETRVLSRGSAESPRDVVEPDAPGFLNGELELGDDAPGPDRRRRFADWVTDPDHPLTARVAANRWWSHVFGTGLVSTPSDFGRAGSKPSHPELLDFLARRLIAGGWSTKAFVRELVLTRAFRQSSLPNDGGLSVDPSAVTLWRFPPRRVEAEVIRDAMLQAAGTLDDSVGGPSYRIHNVKQRYAQWKVVDNADRPTWRRMLYQERMRRVDDRMFTAFDFPDCGQIRARRPVSTTPLQALNLMNGDFVVGQCDALADAVRRAAPDDAASQTTLTFRRILGRPPVAPERDAAADLVRDRGLEQLARVLFNSNEFAFLP